MQKIPDTPKDLIRSLPIEIKTLLFNQWKAKQNERWHPEGNTLKHIIYVLRRAYNKHGDDINIILAALFHDLGKMETYEISPKTGKPTAHGHEKISAEYVLRFRDWIESFEGGNADVVYYIVKNHMAIKPDVWSVMKQSKKDKITSDDNYDKLDKFRYIDKGGIAENKNEMKLILTENQEQEIYFNNILQKKDLKGLSKYIQKRIPFLREKFNVSIDKRGKDIWFQYQFPLTDTTVVVDGEMININQGLATITFKIIVGDNNRCHFNLETFLYNKLDTEDRLLSVVYSLALKKIREQHSIYFDYPETDLETIIKEFNKKFFEVEDLLQTKFKTNF